MNMIWRKPRKFYMVTVMVDLVTKFGKALIDKKGYYVITSTKEGNNGKKLHRLIYEDYYGVTLLSQTDVHHIDGNKLNNDVNNLELLSHSEHRRYHMLGENNPMKSESARIKLSEYAKGRKRDKSVYIKQSKTLSKSQNALGIYRVSKVNCNECNNGFRFRYSCLSNDTRLQISSVDIIKLKDKVIEKGLEWLVVNEEKAENTAKSLGLTLEDIQ